MQRIPYAILSIARSRDGSVTAGAIDDGNRAHTDGSILTLFICLYALAPLSFAEQYCDTISSTLRRECGIKKPWRLAHVFMSGYTAACSPF